MSTNNLTRSCVHCQQAFSPRKPRQRYCTHRCFLDWQTAQCQAQRFRGLCEQCGNSIEGAPCHRHRKRFCSRSCSGRWRAEHTDVAKTGHAASLTERACKHCGQAFIPTSTRQVWCSICVPNEQSRARMRRYGVSQPQIDALYRQQGGGCSLCGSADPECIDHCHITGRVRGLLCRICNMALAYVENTAWMGRARRYLNQ